LNFFGNIFKYFSLFISHLNIRDSDIESIKKCGALDAV